MGPAGPPVSTNEQVRFLKPLEICHLRFRLGPKVTMTANLVPSVTDKADFQNAGHSEPRRRPSFGTLGPVGPGQSRVSKLVGLVPRSRPE